MPDTRSPFDPRFTKQDAVFLASAFRVVADPSRLLIVHLLHRYGPMSGAELVPYLDISQPTVCHHLRILIDSGLVSAKRQGREVANQLVPEALAKLVALITPGGRR